MRTIASSGPLFAAGGQTVELERRGRRIVSMPTAYHVDAGNRARDVVVTASYLGVWPARVMAPHRPRAIIGVDCGIGYDGAGIAGLWFLEALGIPAVAAAVAGVELMNGADVLCNGIVSRRNAAAAACGVAEGMTIADAALLLLGREPRGPADGEDADDAAQCGHAGPRGHADDAERAVVAEHPSGRAVVCLSTIALAQPQDRGRNVLCTGGFAGPPNIRRAAPYGFVCSDGGRGRGDSGLAGLAIGIPGATVDVMTARLGDGRSTWEDGVISACNELAAARGVRVGQAARDAAWLLAAGPSPAPARGAPSASDG
ncbi:hypothetical protein [Conexibacter sp. CPCC 206217]|uniref:hypothetical protein n=1 Tax=Conexibacter sp. CPCC 206217 TaxID=3064574 RepID=UPI002715F062|nr:hypothetical protein [Conexibacter sp. CPCC 206217]MDO8212580.1 hypothetical protein [Conexibacter sp. CPCC 206217]